MRIQKYSILGEAVLAADIWRPSSDSDAVLHPGSHNTTSRRSGTSTATPIAAGIVSLLLEYCRQCTDSGTGSESPKIIRKLFLEMSQPSATLPYRNIAPMLLFNARKSNIMGDFRKIIQRPPSSIFHKILWLIVKTDIENHWFTDKRRKLLEWILPQRRISRHEEIRNKRESNCGEWFIYGEKFQKWLSGASSNLLFLHGIRMWSY